MLNQSYIDECYIFVKIMDGFVTMLNNCHCRVFLFYSVTEAEAKDVHRSLKVAAGIFKTLKVRHASTDKSSLHWKSL